MKLTTSFKHFEHTPSLDEKIQKKTDKLNKFFEGNIDVSWTCSIKDDGKHCAEVKVIGPSFIYHASAESDKMYKSLDLVIQKIQKQVNRKKDKWKNHLSRKHKQSVKEQQMAELEWDEQYWEDRRDDDIAA